MAPDPYRYFRVEAREILDGIGTGLLELEKGSNVPEVVARLLRLAHTLKGAARVVRQRVIADLAHEMEDSLSKLREGSATVERELIDRLLATSDKMREQVALLAAPKPAEEPGPAPGASKEPAQNAAPVPASTEELHALVESVAELAAELHSVRRSVHSLEAVRHTADVLVQRLRLRSAESATGSQEKLALAANEVAQSLGSATRELSQGIERVEREMRQVAETAERLGLVPASSMFPALERAARDAAVSLGKRVTLTTEGGDIRLDPEVLSVVQGALLQAVRNAVAHGIESERDRVQRGKPSSGAITIGVSRRGNRVRFACRDDGRGVDYQEVRRVAERSGKLSPSAPVSDEELVALLLRGGVSTSREVTSVSGRGVGLDIVRETSERLGAKLRLTTELGKGTSLEIDVPPTRAALEALVVEVAGHIAAIPLDAVRQTMRVAPSELVRSSEGDSIVIEGHVVPFAPLARSLRLAASGPTASKTWSAVLLESGGNRAVLGVDRLLGTETVVARPLPVGMPPLAGVAGAALDANGNPRQLLDPSGLISGATRLGREPRSATQTRLPILVIDDSLTTRMLEQSILESAGYDVEVAASAEEGLEKARLAQYSLFLVDVEMPGIDGFTFVERTRADPILRKVPAILVTSRNAEEDKRRGETAGASAYIVKGEFDQTELLRRIERLVG